MTGKALLFVTFVIAICGAASWFGAMKAVSMLEHHTTARITASLHAAGQDWVEVKADGLHLILNGEAGDETARFRALEVTGKLIDTNRIIDHIEIASEITASKPEFSLEILRNGPRLSLFGLVPGEATRQSVLKRLHPKESNRDFTNLVEAVDYDVPKNWENTIELALSIAERFPRSQTRVRPGHVTVTAFVETEAEKIRLENQISNSVPDGVRLDLNLTAPRPVVAPYVFSTSLNDGKFTVQNCTITQAENLASMVARLSPNPDVACILGLGAPSEKWDAAIVAGLEALEQLGGGSLSVEDADFTLIAPANTAKNTYEAAVKRLKNTLPPIFSLHASQTPLPDKNTAAAETITHKFVTSHDPGESVILTGPIRDGTAREATQSYAAALFGFDAVTDEMTLDETVPDGWSKRVLAGLEALAHLHSGRIETTLADMSVIGLSIESSAADEMLTTLNALLGDVTLHHEITYKPLRNADEIPPDPLICAKKIVTLLQSSQIVFAPNSAEIAENSGALLDQIAEVIFGCGKAKFEIGGHTDSQGREEMNLALSQARAEAVLDALLARNVLLNHVSAQGYGESTPIADNDTEKGRTENRRIEFRLLPEPETPDETGKDDE